MTVTWLFQGLFAQGLDQYNKHFPHVIHEDMWERRFACMNILAASIESLYLIVPKYALFDLFLTQPWLFKGAVCRIYCHCVWFGFSVVTLKNAY